MAETYISPKHTFIFDEASDYSTFLQNNTSFENYMVAFCRETSKVSFHAKVDGELLSIQNYTIGNNGVRYVPSNEEFEYMQMWINYNANEYNRTKIDRYKLTIYNYNESPIAYYIDYDNGRYSIYVDSNYQIIDAGFPAA